MIVFLKLFLICSVAGCLAASLMWIFFWLVGVLETPLTVKKIFGIAVTQKPQVPFNGNMCVFVGYQSSQAGMLRLLKGSESSPAFFPDRVNSASISKPWNQISGGQNMAQTHAHSPS